MATSRRVGNYSTSARAVTQASDQIFNAAMESKPDFTAISKEAIKGRSLERRAVTEAEARVASAGLDAFTRTNLTKKKADTEKEIADIKRPAKRMAGIVGGLGALAGGYVTLQNNKKDKAERDELRAYRDELDRKADERDAERDARNAEYLEFLRNRNNGGGDTLDTSTDTSSGTTETKPTSSGSTPAPAAVKPTPVKGIRSKVYNYLTQHHQMGRNAALGLMANIDRESGFRPGIASGDDGGPGGLFQWKGSRQTSKVSELVKAGDWKGQIDYALSEPENLSLVKPGSYQNLQLGSAQEYADWWMEKWERPADLAGGSKKHTQFLGGYNF